MRTALAALSLLAGAASPAEAACRQALALGLDVSGSVDAREYRLQLDGLAAALEHPEVTAAFMALPETPVRLAVYEWSGALAQRLVLDWVTITGTDVLAQTAARLRAIQRTPMDPSTALGAAKRFGARMLSTQGDCWRRVLDVSGDGKSNTGPRPQDVHPVGPVVNALVIGDRDVAELVAYFRAYVIEGEMAFVETALGFEDYEDAMVRKLKRELQVMVLSGR